MPVEATENVAPVVFWRKELRPDSAGAGRTRGGFGQVMEIGAKGDAEFACNAIFDRVAHPAARPRRRRRRRARRRPPAQRRDAAHQGLSR